MGRPALGFELGVSTRAEIRLWAEGRELRCDVVAMGRRLRCRGAFGDVVARFDTAARLRSLDVRRWLEPEGAEAVYLATTQQLQDLVGPATSSVRSDRFVSGAYERAERRFEYRGYDATVTATHFGKRGLQLRERYRATP